MCQSRYVCYESVFSDFYEARKNNRVKLGAIFQFSSADMREFHSFCSSDLRLEVTD